mmetsp:Transcript_24900/g.37211  ORF Transcript_24900/g.37211 Transcript_24900/m.37211 type:complete len:136 (+) Transcript_24900:272-679(+)
MESWSKFHERHGNNTSKRPIHIYGSYISDPRQYERSNEKKGSAFTKVVLCLGCLVGKGGGGHRSEHRSRSSRTRQNVDTRYIYNMNGSFERGMRSSSPTSILSSPAPQLDNESYFRSNWRLSKRSRSRGNINYLQ